MARSFLELLPAREQVVPFRFCWRNYLEDDPPGMAHDLVPATAALIFVLASALIVNFLACLTITIFAAGLTTKP